ncbi:MAG TPA: GAF domain-containing protein [Smithellaceae bacterium]|nr:GAF domain-containing protein [Smithellaceae bacterium]
MNKNALSRKLNGLAVFAMIIPLIVGIWAYAQYRDTLNASILMVPVAAYAVFLCCMIVMIYMVNRGEKKYAEHLEKSRREAAHRVSELNALRDISEMTQDGMPAEDMLKLILNKAMQVVAVRNGSIFVVDPSEPEGLRLVDARPPVVFARDDSGKPHRFSFVKSVIESGKALLIEDIESDPRTMRANDPRYGAPSFISMPVYKNKQVMAVINLANKENNGVFTESDERILTIMLAKIGIGIENISLHHQIKLQQAQIKELQARLK